MRTLYYKLKLIKFSRQSIERGNHELYSIRQHFRHFFSNRTLCDVPHKQVKLDIWNIHFYFCTCFMWIALAFEIDWAIKRSGREICYSASGDGCGHDVLHWFEIHAIVWMNKSIQLYGFEWKYTKIYAILIYQD